MGNNNYESQGFKFSQLNEVYTKKMEWSGEYTILRGNSNRHDQIIKKIIYLQSHEEAKSYLKHFYTLEKHQFYIRNPLALQMLNQHRICSLSETVIVYHQNLLPSLEHKIQTLAQHSLNQCQIWFILTEITHSLQILYDRGHPHLWITPQTIFYNKNQNWFLEDMHYWQGTDYQNFMKYKSFGNQLISKSMKNLIQRYEFFDINSAMDEDTYCLGYIVVYMMTGIEPLKARPIINKLLEQCEAKYTKKLVNLVRMMIEQMMQRRITMQKLRYRLKADQQLIIAEEIKQFKTVKDNKRRYNTDHQSSMRHSQIAIKTPTRASLNRYPTTNTHAKTSINTNLYIPNTLQNQSLKKKSYKTNKKISNLIDDKDYKQIHNPWNSNDIRKHNIVSSSKNQQKLAETSPRIRAYYSPHNYAPKKTSEFILHSPRY